MSIKIETLTREQLIEEVRASKRSFVLQKLDGEFVDLNLRRLANFDNQPYAIQRKTHEVIVIDHKRSHLGEAG